jgi:hypothetical protein
MKFKSLRSQTTSEIIDYLQLSRLLAVDYLRPRDKIRSLLKSKQIIRIKKGLYVFGKEESRGPFSKETLANLIYGPSAISLEYALSMYGMIPERVESITSITNKRDKVFNTPAGRFTYRYIHPSKYDVGITQIMLNEAHFVLIATPEKALADKLMLASENCIISNMVKLEAYLFEDLRLDESAVSKLRINRLQKIKERYKNKKVDLLFKFIVEQKK